MANIGTLIAAEADKYVPVNLAEFTFDHYSTLIGTFDQSGLESYGSGRTPLWYYMLGLAGETGEYQEKVFAGKWVAFEMGRELGDVLWYSIRGIEWLGFKPSTIVLADSFDKYQEHVVPTERGVYHYAVGLGANVGRTVDKVKKLYRNGQTDALTAEQKLEIAVMLGSVIRMITMNAAVMGMRLAEIGKWNVEKLADRTRRNVVRSEGDNR